MRIKAQLQVEVIQANGLRTVILEEAADSVGDNPRFTAELIDKQILDVRQLVLARLTLEEHQSQINAFGVPRSQWRKVRDNPQA